MGAEPYDYTVPYEADFQLALDKLRNQVFASGEFYPAELNPATPEEAMEMAEECGTRSILDIQTISDTPDYCCAAPCTSEELQSYFGTDKPSAKQVSQSDAFWEDLQRGMARYIVIYEEGEPQSIYFAGYSFD